MKGGVNVVYHSSISNSISLYNIRIRNMYVRPRFVPYKEKESFLVLLK